MENIDKPSTSIKNWAMDDRPREKLFAKGATALSDSELLAILINNGYKERSAVEISKEILKKIVSKEHWQAEEYQLLFMVTAED